MPPRSSESFRAQRIKIRSPARSWAVSSSSVPHSGRAVLRVGVVVVETGAVAEHEVAFDFDKAQFPRRILREIMRLVEILAQFLDVESAHVGVGILAVIIPAHEHAGFGGAAHQGDGLGHNVQVFLRVAGDADFRFDAELDEGRMLWQRSSVKITDESELAKSGRAWRPASVPTAQIMPPPWPPPGAGGWGRA